MGSSRTAQGDTFLKRTAQPPRSHPETQRQAKEGKAIHRLWSSPPALPLLQGQASGQGTLHLNFIQSKKDLKILFSSSNGDKPRKAGNLWFFCLFGFFFLFVPRTKEILLKIRNLANFHQGITNKVRRAALGLGMTALKNRRSLQI